MATGGFAGVFKQRGPDAAPAKVIEHRQPVDPSAF
jgi:hypothetical protein